MKYFNTAGPIKHDLHYFIPVAQRINIDEIKMLIEQAARPQNFPQSVILCGVRDIRDYRIHASSEKEIVTGGSCFNVNAESLNIGNLSAAEVQALYQQHTDATVQVFTP